ncbi:hypothetical protein EGY14_20185 [Burkholderia pseudomallei]|nr:hypothetical protein EGY14_20185 [Burkholderia pseudomallei]
MMFRAFANVGSPFRPHDSVRHEVRHHNFLLSIMLAFVMHMSFTTR